jgi:hypothetical protein
MSTTAVETWGEGTASSPKFRVAFDEQHDDLKLSGRYYTFTDDVGLVAGATVDLTCTFDKPARDVWPYFKDHTLWQDAYHHYYSGVLGDLEGGTFMINTEPRDWAKHRYDVLRVIPEHVIMVNQPIPGDDESYSIGAPHPQGGVSPGCMVFMISEYGGQTVLNIFMEHRFRSTGLSEDEALGTFWWMPDALLKWREVFIPALKMLVYDGEIPDSFKEHWRNEQQKEAEKYASVLSAAKGD